MEEIDQLIKDTLSKEEAAFYDSLEEQNVFASIFDLFKGKNAWFMILANILTVVFFGCFIYCVMQFFKATGDDALIKWGLGSIICLFGVSMLKIYAWMQMNKNALLREMKRLELQVVSLRGRLEE